VIVSHRCSLLRDVNDCWVITAHTKPMMGAQNTSNYLRNKTLGNCCVASRKGACAISHLTFADFTFLSITLCPLRRLFTIECHLKLI
jgi:hypothetical protein